MLLSARFFVPDELRQLLLKFFNGDGRKVGRWYTTRNPLLGDLTPMTFVKQGREDKLMNWVRQQLAENERVK